MRIQQKNSHKKHFIIGTIALVLIATAILYWFVFRSQRNTQTNTTESSLDTQASNSTNPNNSNQATPQQPTAPITGSPAKPGDVTGGDSVTTSKPRIAVKITSLEQDSNGLHVEAAISAASSGTCILELSSDGQSPISKTVNMSKKSSDSSTCSVMDFQSSTLSRGSATLTIKAISGSDVATVTQSITIK